jgi:hypothetical protein
MNAKISFFPANVNAQKRGLHLLPALLDLQNFNTTNKESK